MLPVLKRAFWILAVMVFLLGLFLPGYTKLQELRDKNRDLITKIKHLKIENSLLEQELRRVEDDPFYNEKIVREKMGIVRKGEIPVRIVPEPKR